MKAPTKDTLIEGEVLARQLTKQREGELATIAQRFGDGLPYNRDRLIGVARTALQDSAAQLFAAGRALIWLKEMEPQGEFYRVLDEVGIPDRGARKLMQAVAKYSQGPRTKLADLGRTKLLELIAEDDETLDALADGGTVAGLTRDDIAAMSARELRDALRAAREKADQDRAAHDRILEGKNKKIDELDRALHDRSVNEATDWQRSAALTLENVTQDVLAAMIGLERHLSDLHGRDDTPEPVLVQGFQALLRIQTRVQELMAAFPTYVAAPEDDDSWVAQVNASSAQAADERRN